MFENPPNSEMEFKEAVLFESIRALKLNLFQDNFDATRFNLDGVDRSNFFNVPERVVWLSWFFETYKDLFRAYRLLNSEKSKHRFLTILAYRLAGHHSMRIATSYDTSQEAHGSYMRLEGGTPSKLPTRGMFGNLKHLDFDFMGKHYLADCLGLEYCLFRNQYFFNEDGVRIQPEENDCVVDAGACLGDACPTASPIATSIAPPCGSALTRPVSTPVVHLFRFGPWTHSSRRVKFLPSIS
ncbi:MAG: hypothetical protein LW713_16085 [Acetobacteraceae bacterium]|nr:hypothetical protein [Acetobacteraceae bacterium]